jgi:hypothetical protein
VPLATGFGCKLYGRVGSILDVYGVSDEGFDECLVSARFATVRFFFRKQPLDRELDAEMQSHLQMAVDENLRQGLSMQEARRQAMVRFGGVERTLSFYSCAASFADKSHGCAAE